MSLTDKHDYIADCDCLHCKWLRIEIQQDRITELEAENAALRKDAERYRWLNEWKPAKQICVVTGKYGDDILDGKKLDAAIDAAMAEKGDVLG